MILTVLTQTNDLTVLFNHLKTNGYTRRQAAIALGKNDRYFYHIKNLSAELMCEVCELLGMTPNDFYGVDSRPPGKFSPRVDEFLTDKAIAMADEVYCRMLVRLSLKRPDPIDIINWLDSNNGVFVPDGNMFEFMDHYEKPAEGQIRMRPIKVGKESYTNDILVEDQFTRLNQFIEAVPEDQIAPITHSYLEVAEGEFPIRKCLQRVNMPAYNLNFEVEYWRLQASGKSILGAPVIGTYAIPIVKRFGSSA